MSKTVKIPILGIVESKTGNIKFFNKKDMKNPTKKTKELQIQAYAISPWSKTNPKYLNIFSDVDGPLLIYRTEKEANENNSLMEESVIPVIITLGTL